MRKNGKIKFLAKIISRYGFKVFMASESGDPEVVFFIHGPSFYREIGLADLEAMSFKEVKEYATLLLLEEMAG
jgi:hypothetical protein